MDALIGELLHQHECVIVPGLGGFLTNYSPARIHPVNHVFVPPSRYIVFNAGLTSNDGILANYISEVKNISFRESMDQITLWVNEQLYKIKSGKECKIENIGSFSFDRENNLQFEPSNKINYLTDSYGLSSFVSPPIKRYEDDLTDLSAKRRSNYRSLSVGLKWAAVLLPFAGVALWGSLHTRDISGLYMNYSSFMPWENTAGSINSHAESVKSTGIVFTELDMVNSSVIADRSGLIKIDQTVPAIESEIQTPVPKKNTPEQENSPAASIKVRYHIIGGAFRIFENAGNYVDALKRKGYPASIVDKNRHGLFVVSISGFQDKESAVTQLLSIRTTENPDAWIMTR
jgi:hypothetical protein